VITPFITEVPSHPKEIFTAICLALETVQKPVAATADSMSIATALEMAHRK